MKYNFNDCLTRVLKDEGGYTNDPQDPGGPTNYGITLTDYRKYINPKGTASDVKGMTVDQAKLIYKAQYWDALGCDSLPSGVDYTCFDYGVNSGLGRPRNALRRFKSQSGTRLINSINDERMAFLQSLKTYSRFGGGWSKRVAGVRAHSVDMATQKNVTAGPVIAAGTVGIGTYLSQFWSTYEIPIIVGTIALAALIGYGIYKYLNKGKHG